MSEPTPIEPLRQLRSPFNGEAWTVPPEVTPEMYAALLERGFKEIAPAKPKRREDARVTAG